MYRSKMKHRIRARLFAAAIVLATLPAKADDQGPGFTLVAGAGLPVCEALLSAALAALPEAARQCDLSDPGVANDAPGTFIDWALLQNHLGPDFATPQWRALDLSRPDQLERALFALGVTYASVLDNSRSSGIRRWTEVMTDAEIRTLIQRYIAEGGLPKQLLAFAQDLQIDPQHSFYEAELRDGGFGTAAILMNHTPVGLPPICFDQSTQALLQIIVSPQPNLGSDRAQSVALDDVLVFDGQLYGVGYMDRKRSFYPDTVRLWPLVDGALAGATPACELAAGDPG